MAKATLIAFLLFYGACAYLCGYHKADKDLEGKWFEGPEGYCLADKPPHPGECHE